MRKTIFLILIIFGFGIPKIEAQKNEASDEILSKIVNAETAVKDGTQLNQADLNEIVCLTNMATLKYDGNYFGISYFPSINEIQLWKDWFEKNKTRISYSTSSDSNFFSQIYYQGQRKVIRVEYENGKFRNSVCDEDQNFQKRWKKKK